MQRPSNGATRGNIACGIEINYFRNIFHLRTTSGRLFRLDEVHIRAGQEHLRGDDKVYGIRRSVTISATRVTFFMALWHPPIKLIELPRY
jgi:hypothetical protein